MIVLLQLDGWIAWEPLLALLLFALLGAVTLRRYGASRFVAFGVAAVLVYTGAWLVLFPGTGSSSLSPRTIAFAFSMTLVPLSAIAGSMLLLARKTNAGVVAIAALGASVSLCIWLALPIIGLPAACAFLRDCI